MKLAELEHYFAEVATSTSGPPSDLDAVFKGSTALQASARLAIYNRGYHYRLLDALASVFARTKRALGDAEFERLGLRYIARHPSEHPAVERVGSCFPEFLRALPEVSQSLVDLAALEWAHLQALVAPNPGQLAAAQGIDPGTFPDSPLCFVASLSILPVTPDALALFAQDSASVRGAAPCGVAVWRKRNVVRHEALEPLELAALELALTGASVSQVCALFESGADAEAEDAQRAFRVVSSWFSREWLEDPRAKPR